MKSKDIFDALCEAGDRVHDPWWLVEFIVRHIGCVCASCGNYPQPQEDIPRTVQEPLELAQWLYWIRDRAAVIYSYLEIGSSSGGTLFLVDSWLRLHNPQYEGSMGIDRLRRPRGLDGYQARFPTLQYQQVNSLEFQPERTYDLVLIDGDHRERFVRRDLELALRVQALWTVLHDVQYPGIEGPGRVLREVAVEKSVIRSPVYHDRSPGLGIIRTAGLTLEKVLNNEPASGSV